MTPFREQAGALCFIATVICAYYITISAFFLGHSDLGWHLAAGDLIRSSHHVPLTDPWAFTSAGQRWYNLSWLWDVAASLLFQYGHYTALIIATLFLGVTIAVTLSLLCLKSGASVFGTSAAVIASCIIFPTYALPDIFLAAAPQVVTLLFCIIIYGICTHRRYLWLTPLLMALWANLHGGFPLGLFIFAVFAFTALLRKDGIALKTYLLWALCCFCATFFTPYGVEIYTGIFRTIGHFHQHYVSEWQPYFSVVNGVESVPCIIYLLLFCIFDIKSGRSAALELRILSWCFLLLGLWQLRYLSLFLVLSAIPLSQYLSRINSQAQVYGKSYYGYIGFILLCLLPLLYNHFHKKQLEILGALSPQNEIAFIQEHYPEAHLLNHWNYGGFIIFQTHGTLPVFVDGRASTAYPDTLLRDNFTLLSPQFSPPAWDAVLQKYAINAVLWPTQISVSLEQFFIGKPGWKRVYSGKIATLFVKVP